MSFDEAVSILQFYGVEQILSEQDDARLWATIFSKNWPVPFSEKLRIASLRFGIGRIAPETYCQIQPIEAWCFERVANNLLKVKECSDTAPHIDAAIDKKLKGLVNSVLFYLPFADTEYPRSSIVITRPSRNKTEAFVFVGWEYAHLFGRGATHKWVYHRNGTWEETGEPMGYWRS
jgi:hypothetical protein